MKKFKHYALLLLVAVMALTTSCGEDYDDTAIKKDIADLQSRVEKLEKWCDTANGQITSLQGLVTTLQNNDYVTGVTPVMEGTEEVGYTISFTKSKPVTIMHGTNGKDGVTPVIGVKKHTDNLYYWTIQTGSGETDWMKDVDDNMIPTTGKDGAAGQKPTISIAKDGDRYYWKINDIWLEDANGQKVPATGDKGAQGDKGDIGAAGTNGDSFFDSVTPDATKGTVVIKLANGTEFTLPMLSTTVSFDAYTPLQIAAIGAETAVVVTLPASLKKADFAAIKADITNVAGTNSAITRAAAEKWTVTLTAPTFKQDGTLDAQPTVKVTVPASAIQDETALLEVTVVDTKGNKSTSTRVLYYDNRVAVTGVMLAPATTTVKVGKTQTLTANVAPANATTKDVTWVSSDITVATVDATGVVTGVKAGTATITVSTTDGNFTATCAVTVENIAVTGISLTDASISLNEKKTLTPTITPADATVKTVTWKSSKPAIATVSADGMVTGVAAGEATITATTTDGSKTATCKVTVTEGPLYAVGDAYPDDTNPIGVVAMIDGNKDKGAHGLIISLDESSTPLVWSTENVLIGANGINQDASTNNMNKIKATPNFATAYPAAKWCADKGEGWLLPSGGALYNAALTNKEAVNAKLATIPNAVKIEQRLYHTSTEENATGVIVTMNGAPVSGMTKSQACYVRAMKRF